MGVPGECRDGLLPQAVEVLEELAEVLIALSKAAIPSTDFSAVSRFQLDSPSEKLCCQVKRFIIRQPQVAVGAGRHQPRLFP